MKTIAKNASYSRLPYEKGKSQDYGLEKINQGAYLNKIITVFLFWLILLFTIDRGFAIDYSEPLSTLSNYTKDQQEKLYTESSLVFEATYLDLQMIDKGAWSISAFARDPEAYENQTEMIRELPWVLRFDINKVLKGDRPEKQFNILIHSPSTQFGININKPEENKGKKYKIYILYKENPERGILIGQEPLLEK